jgi:hypothetical protein
MSRYYLFNVPKGATDRMIKDDVADLINYPDAIRGMRWIVQPNDFEYGVVQLQLDEKGKPFIF